MSKKKSDESMTSDADRKGEEYTDDEIRLILSLMPTQANAAVVAKALRRTPKGIELFYRFAVTEAETVRRSHPSKSRPGEARGYLERIIQIRKELGWCL